MNLFYTLSKDGVREELFQFNVFKRLESKVTCVLCRRIEKYCTLSTITLLPWLLSKSMMLPTFCRQDSLGWTNLPTITLMSKLPLVTFSTHNMYVDTNMLVTEPNLLPRSRLTFTHPFWPPPKDSVSLRVLSLYPHLVSSSLTPTLVRGRRRASVNPLL